jgi:transportin-3
MPQVTFDLQQVDPSHRVGLRDSLISALRTFASGPRVIVIQICLALSGLALQMPEWKNVVPGLIESFGQDPSTVPALLQFLTVLPEEVNGNTRIPMSVSPISQPWSNTDHTGSTSLRTSFLVDLTLISE